MPITTFRNKVEAILVGQGVRVNDEMRVIIRECWQDYWTPRLTAKYIMKQEKGA